MDEVVSVFRLLAVSQAILWASYFIVFHRRQREAWIATALSVCFSSYLVLPILFSLETAPVLLFSVALLSNLIPALVWLLAHYLAHDSRRIPKWFWCVSLVYVILIMLPSDIKQSTSATTFLKQLFFFYCPQLIKLALVVHVIVLALLDRKNDLVQARRRLRIPIVLISAGVVTLVILIELGISGRSIQIVELIGSLLLFLFTLLVSMTLFTLKPTLATLLQPIQTVISEPPLRQPNQDPGIKRILHAMERDRFYSNHGITLDDLANHVSLPAYRTRNLINQHLGFRNFNHFLNHYRIAEAAMRLRSQIKLPILTIALDVGFRSLSSFNQAFKDTYQKTPTEFRQQDVGSKD